VRSTLRAQATAAIPAAAFAPPRRSIQPAPPPCRRTPLPEASSRATPT
jgi:hypothetical protein